MHERRVTGLTSCAEGVSQTEDSGVIDAGGEDLAYSFNECSADVAATRSGRSWGCNNNDIPDEHIRRIDASTVEQPPKVIDLIARVVHARPRDACGRSQRDQ